MIPEADAKSWLQQSDTSPMPPINVVFFLYTLGKKGCYTPGWCVFFVVIFISSVREV